MENFSQQDINSIFASICCSHCKNNFTKNSVKILENFGDIYSINLSCEKCGKDFGNVLLKFNKNEKYHGDMQILEGAPVINYDDVIDAHRYIKNNL